MPSDYDYDSKQMNEAMKEHSTICKAVNKKGYDELYKKLTEKEINDFTKCVGILNHGKRVPKKLLETMSKNTQECVKIFDKEVASVWRASGKPTEPD